MDEAPGPAEDGQCLYGRRRGQAPLRRLGRQPHCGTTEKKKRPGLEFCTRYSELEAHLQSVLREDGTCGGDSPVAAAQPAEPALSAADTKELLAAQGGRCAVSQLPMAALQAQVSRLLLRPQRPAKRSLSESCHWQWGRKFCLCGATVTGILLGVTPADDGGSL